SASASASASESESDPESEPADSVAPADAAEDRPEEVEAAAEETDEPAEDAAEEAATAGAAASSDTEASPSGKDRPGEAKRRFRTALGITGGALLVAAVAAAAVAPRFLPEAAQHESNIPSVRSGAGTSTYVCPPTVQRVGEEATSDQAYDSGAQKAGSSLSVMAQGDQAQRIPGVTVLSDDRTVKELSKDLPADEAADGDAAQAADGYSGVKGVVDRAIDTAQASWVKVQPLGGSPSPAAATRTIQQGSGDLTGFAAPGCAPTSNTVWLTGATTTVGHTAVLSVTNPSDTPAGLSATVYTKDGEVSTGAIQSFTLEAGETRSLNLGGTAVDAEASAVKVESSGAPVSASINQSVLRGTTPGGIDTITAGSPDTTQVMTGVSVPGKEASAKLGRSESAGDQNPQVQIADATGAGTQVSVVARDQDGKATELESAAELPANGVLGVDLSSLKAGTWSIEVAGSDSIVATARTMKGTDPKSARDVGYVVATPALSTDQFVAVPTKGDASLRMTAVDGDGTVTVVPVNADGEPGKAATVDVKEGAIAARSMKDLGNPAGLRIAGTSGTVYASVASTSGDSGIGYTAVQQLPLAPGTTQVDVLP
ncbi:MAG: DUF5719 family protein, partial [Galactobacter sp.]